MKNKEYKKKINENIQKFYNKYINSHYKDINDFFMYDNDFHNFMDNKENTEKLKILVYEGIITKIL